MSKEDLISEINSAKVKIQSMNKSKLESFYESFGDTEIIYSDKSKKVLKPFYWIQLGEGILNNLKVTINRHGRDK